MKKYQLQSAPSNSFDIESVTESWRKKEFYSSAVVLGIDIGLEGIGVCLRQGQQILHAATWVLPWAKPLADRRAKRAWRRCRLNRKIRLSRLRRLFERNGLPWFEDRDAKLLGSDPFELRYMALVQGLDTADELSLAIRHVVAHRGHHYNYYNDEGEYPWGDDHSFAAACSAIKFQYLTSDEADKFAEDCVEFGWTEAKVEEFRALVESRRATGSEILERLTAYCSQPRRNLRRSPKGIAYPRSLVWRHLEEIVRKNAHLLPDSERFLKELGVRPETSKSEAIFFYHRKTPTEMRDHFEKKTKRCAFSSWLGFGDNVPCDTRDNLEVRKFLLLEYLATRRVEIVRGHASRVNLPAIVIQKLLAWQEEVESSERTNAPGWREGKKAFEAALKEAGTWPLAKGSPFNDDFLERLQDLLCPTPANRKKKSNLSARAAKHLFEMATKEGYGPASVVRVMGEYFKKRREAVLDPSGRYPQVDFLLGAVAKRNRTPTKRHPNRKQRGEAASVGKLQQLFKRYADKLNDAKSPEFCIIEVIGDPPRSEKQKREYQKEIQKRRAEHEKRLESLGSDSRTSRTARLRMKLFEQQRGKSPFSGVPLGDDPLAEDLQLCHLYPYSRGGLFTEENLVLAPRIENVRMGNRTPKEAANELAGSWDTMLSFAKDMKWSRLKIDIFCWDEESAPDFGNTTRMSQLARQLYVAVGDWMGLSGIEDPLLRENRRQERIGTPSGFVTAIARAAWHMPRKDRNDLVHHAVDAITLAWLAPGVGMNSVQCGGILYNERVRESGKTRLSVLPLGPAPDEVEAVTSDSADACPVVHFRSSSAKAQMHDSTILSVRPDGRLASRESVGAKKEELDPIAVKQQLLDSGIPRARIPSDSQIEAWISNPDSSHLVLRDGQSVRRRIKFASKETTLFPGLGLMGKSTGHARWQGIRIVNASKYDGVELWKDYDFRKSRWRFLLRRIPEPRAMESLLRMAFSWFSLAEAEMQPIQKPLADRIAKTLRTLEFHPQRWRRISRGSTALEILRNLVEIGFPIDGVGSRGWDGVEEAIYGDLLPATAIPVLDGARPVIVRKGKTVRIPVEGQGKLAAMGRPFELHWFEVSAIQSDGRVKFRPIRRPDWKELYLSRGNLFKLFGLSVHDDPPRHLTQ